MHVTRLTWLAVAAGAALAVGCGEGRLIFNVNVLSFLKTGDSTVPYSSPPDTVKNPPIVFHLPAGLGSKATVDSVAVTVGANVENATGSGWVRFQILFASDSSSLYTTKPYAQDSAYVMGKDSAPLAPPPIAVFRDTVFTNDRVFLGVRLITQSGMTGRLRLTVLRVLIFLQDHLFQ